MAADKFEDSTASTAGENPSDWGPFAPPPDFGHEPEFAADPPRPLPEFTRGCYYVRTRQATVWICAMIASACWATKSLPFVETLSWYLLPLGYLRWISLGFAALMAFYWLRNSTTKGFLEYIRRGEPLIGRVRRVDVRIEGVKEAPFARFVAEVEFQHPVSGQIQITSLSTPHPFPYRDLSTMESGLVPGEYVKLVYLPDRLEKSLQVYGWLGLDPGLDLIRKNGRPLQPRSPLTVLLVVTGITALLWAVLALLYVIGRYAVFENESWQPYAIGIGLAVMPFVIVLAYRVNRAGAPLRAAIKKYLFAVLAGLFCGSIVGFPAVGFVNGYFDRSPTHFEPVTIVQGWQTTHELIVRTYELEYHPFPAGKTEKQMVPVETLAMFAPDSLAVIDVGSGRLGMRWLRNFHPIVWHTVTDDGNKELPGELKFQLPAAAQPTRIAPQVVMSETSFLPPPEVLLPPLRERMVSHLINNLKAKLIEGDK